MNEVTRFASLAPMEFSSQTASQYGMHASLRSLPRFSSQMASQYGMHASLRSLPRFSSQMASHYGMHASLRSLLRRGKAPERSPTASGDRMYWVALSCSRAIRGHLFSTESH